MAYRNVCYGLGVLGLWIGSWIPHVMPAQSIAPGAASHVAPTGPVLPVSLAGITTDTGAFAAGHQEFSRYTSPLWCVDAATSASQTARSNLTTVGILDTLQDVAADTFGLGEVRRVAQACGARFTFANTEAKYLPALFQVAWAAQNDSLAQTVFTRMMQTFLPPVRVLQAITTLDVVLDGGLPASSEVTRTSGDGAPLLRTAPSLNDSMVQTILQVIDQQGSLVTRTRIYERLREYAMVRHDTVGIQRYTAQVLMSARQLPVGTLVDSVLWSNRFQPVWRTYHDLLRNAYYHAPDSVHAIAQRAQQDLGAWQSYRPVSGIFRKADVIDFRQLSVAATINTLWPGHTRWDDTARKVMPQLHADVWFGPAHTAIARTHARMDSLAVPPIRGQVTFIMTGWVNANTQSGARQATLVRRLLANYGAQGLVVTVMTKTHGWINYGDYGRALEPLSVAAEAEQIRSYYQDYQGLPVTVGIQVPHYTKRLPPDSRLVQVDSLHLAPPYCDVDDARDCAQLVGRDGTVLWNEEMLDSDAEGMADGGALLGTHNEFTDVLVKALAEPSPRDVLPSPTPRTAPPMQSSASVLAPTPASTP